VKELFSHLLNVHNASDVGQIEVHTAEPLLDGSIVLKSELLLQVEKE
jgi:hypothetical protein